MSDTVEVDKSNLSKLLDMIRDSTLLLEDIPKMQDEGRECEAAQVMGETVASNYSDLNQIGNENDFVRRYTEPSTELHQLERDLLG